MCAEGNFYSQANTNLFANVKKHTEIFAVVLYTLTSHIR